MHAATLSLGSPRRLSESKEIPSAPGTLSLPLSLSLSRPRKNTTETKVYRVAEQTIAGPVKVNKPNSPEDFHPLLPPSLSGESRERNEENAKYQSGKRRKGTKRNKKKERERKRKKMRVIQGNAAAGRKSLLLPLRRTKTLALVAGHSLHVVSLIVTPSVPLFRPYFHGRMRIFTLGCCFSFSSLLPPPLAPAPLGSLWFPARFLLCLGGGSREIGEHFPRGGEHSRN